MSTLVSSVALFYLGGRHGSDQVVDINRIRWSTSLGTSGRHHRNAHSIWDLVQKELLRCNFTTGVKI